MNKYLEQHANYDVGHATQAAFVAGYLYGKHEQQIKSFEELRPEEGLSINGDIILNHVERDVLMDFLKSFGGNWKKEIEEYDQTKMCYSQEFPHPFYPNQTYKIKAGYAPPPPSCQIVEEEVEIPATKKIIKKIVCKEEEEVNT